MSNLSYRYPQPSIPAPALYSLVCVAEALYLLPIVDAAAHVAVAADYRASRADEHEAADLVQFALEADAALSNLVLAILPFSGPSLNPVADFNWQICLIDELKFRASGSPSAARPSLDRWQVWCFAHLSTLLPHFVAVAPAVSEATFVGHRPSVSGMVVS